MPLIPQTGGAYKPKPSLAMAARLPSTGGLYAGSTPNAPPAKPPVTPRKPAPQVPPGQVPKVAQQLTMEQQAQQTVTQWLKPLIDQITQASQTRSTQGTAAITGYADALAKELGSVNYAAPYQGAEQRQAAVDSSLASASSGQGLADANDLASRLAVINDPTVATAAGNVAANGAANGTTLLAQGSNSLRQLISNEASAKGYGLKQPGIAKLSGLQDISALQGKISADQADALAKIAAESPQLALSLTGQLRSSKDRKAALESTNAYRAAQLGQSGAKIKAASKKEAYQEWLGVQKLDQSAKKMGFDQWYKNQQLGISQQRADISAGQLSLSQQKRADALEQKVKTGGFTKAQIAAFAKRAQKAAADAWNGTPAVQYTQGQPDANGNVHEIPVHGTIHRSYQEAIRDMLAAGIPLTIAQKALNSYWAKPGQTAKWEHPGQGRPLRSYQERNPKAAAAQDAASARSPEGAKAAAFQIAQTQYGWSGQDLAALERLWTNESGWSYTAHNPSGAHGIPQALGHKLPADYSSNPLTQINWGLDYIKQRYGSPSKALAFWYGPKPAGGPQGHWY